MYVLFAKWALRLSRHILKSHDAHDRGRVSLYEFRLYVDCALAVVDGQFQGALVCKSLECWITIVSLQRPLSQVLGY